jgi:hypothetical protein
MPEWKRKIVLGQFQLAEVEKEPDTGKPASEFKEGEWFMRMGKPIPMLMCNNGSAYWQDIQGIIRNMPADQVYQYKSCHPVPPDFVPPFEIVMKDNNVSHIKNPAYRNGWRDGVSFEKLHNEDTKRLDWILGKIAPFKLDVGIRDEREIPLYHQFRERQDIDKLMGEEDTITNAEAIEKTLAMAKRVEGERVQAIQDEADASNFDEPVNITITPERDKAVRELVECVRSYPVTQKDEFPSWLANTLILTSAVQAHLEGGE